MTKPYVIYITLSLWLALLASVGAGHIPLCTDEAIRLVEEIIANGDLPMLGDGAYQQIVFPVDVCDGSRIADTVTHDYLP